MTLTVFQKREKMESLLHLNLYNIVFIVSVILGKSGIPLTTIYMKLAYVVAKYNTEHTL